MQIMEATSREDFDAARRLFREYAAWLGIDLTFQGFKEEVAALPGAYARPDGLLLLAEAGGTRIGCIGLRKIADSVGEIKRLYVMPAYRGRGIGRLLIERVIHEAPGIGYGRLRLDTIPRMEAARQLYATLGFQPIAPYYPTPVPHTEFMELVLTGNRIPPNFAGKP
jgi:carbonic anhydrase